LGVPANDLAGAAAIVRAEDVHKYFGRSHVLRGVSLSVRKGEIVCIIGRSGSGKTTFLRCINRLERIDRGRLEVNGGLIGYRVGKNGALKERSDSSLARQRIDIGFVFQRLNLWPNKTALENIIEGPLAVWRLARAEAVVQGERLLARVRLSEKRNVYPNQLSAGEQQRVAIARALAMNPTLMLFDDPTSALDPETIHETVELMKGLAADGMTTLVVSQELGFAYEVADRIAVMDDGAIVEEGEPAHLFSSPRHSRTEDFLSKVL
jgi:polar amino acid transport system ATP-binding protein